MPKVFEKTIYKQLQTILLDLHIIPDHQFAFRAKYRTIGQVRWVTNSVLEAKELYSAFFLNIK